MSNESGKIWKEAIVVSVKVSTLAQTEENNDKQRVA
jgi:hypothetical protein